MKRPVLLLILLLLAAIFLLFMLNLLLGSVSIPFGSVWQVLWGEDCGNPVWQNIVWKSRVPQALTALVAGAGLSVSGLQMQTVFRNPLADPSVLGVSAGASLGVACVVLLSGSLGGVALSRLGYIGEVSMSVAAIVGAMSVMVLIAYVSMKVRGTVTLLIIGVMIGYVASAIIGVLKFFSVEEDIRAYVIWGLGSFARVSGDQVGLFIAIMGVLLPLSFLLIKTMNLLLLGNSYARNPGSEYQACPPAGDNECRGAGGHRDGLLRPHHVYRSGRAPFVPCPVSDIRPPHPHARYAAGRGCFGLGVQPGGPYAGV